MKNILNEAPGQEGYAIGAKIKDVFFTIQATTKV